MVSNVKRVLLLVFLTGQNMQGGDQAIFKQNEKKNHRRTGHQDLLKTDRAAKPWHRMSLNCWLMGFGGCAREGTSSVLFLVLFL